MPNFSSLTKLGRTTTVVTLLGFILVFSTARSAGTAAAESLAAETSQKVEAQSDIYDPKVIRQGLISHTVWQVAGSRYLLIDASTEPATVVIDSTVTPDEIQKMTSVYNRAGYDVQLTQVPYSQKDVEKAMNIALSWLDYGSVDFSASSNTILLEGRSAVDANGNQLLKNELATENVKFNVSFAERPPSDVNRVACTSRLSCSAPLWAGVKIGVSPSGSFLGNGCTAGFAFTSGSNGYIATAGHCLGSTNTVTHPAASATPIGTANWDYRSSKYDLLRVNVGQAQVSSRFYQTSTSWSDVTSMAQLPVGANVIGQGVCASLGQSNATNCSNTVTTTVRQEKFFPSEPYADTYVKLSSTFVIGGDSGSPVIMQPWCNGGVKVIDAAGSITANVTNFNGIQQTVFTPISGVASPNGNLGTLRTTAQSC